jgi:hypothetical protein
MPRSIAHIPQNRWAWILKDRMEETHKHARENVKGAMPVIFVITLKGPLQKHASLVVNPGLTFGKKTNT